MKLLNFKKASAILLAALLANSPMLQASCHHHRCHERPDVDPERLVNELLAASAFHTYLNDLNVILLNVSVSGDPTITTAYTDNANTQATALANALNALDRDNSPGLEGALQDYITAANAVAQGLIGSDVGFQTASTNLANALSALLFTSSDSTIASLVSQLTTDINSIVTNNNIPNYPAAIAANNAAHVVANELLAYLFINLRHHHHHHHHHS